MLSVDPELSQKAAWLVSFSSAVAGLPPALLYHLLLWGPEPTSLKARWCQLALRKAPREALDHKTLIQTSATQSPSHSGNMLGKTTAEDRLSYPFPTGL